MPQYSDEAFEQNLELLDLIRNLASEKNATPAQISLAWILGKKPYIVPISGSRKTERIKENILVGYVTSFRRQFIFELTLFWRHFSFVVAVK